MIELTKEDVDRYERNPISFVLIETATHHRLYIGNIRRNLILYIFVEAIEIGRLFPSKFILMVYTGDWKEKEENPSSASNDIDRKLSLGQYLRRCGWYRYILKSWLVLDEENLIIESQFFSQRGVKNLESDHFQLASGMEEEEADFEECESEEIEE